MGVDYYTCHNCEETFSDCGEYVSCESCGTVWCDKNCASEDGYIEEHCKKYNVSGYSDLQDERNIRNCTHKYCSDACEFYVPDSCKFCRGEDYEDNVLLGKALELLSMTREALIEKMKG